MAHPTSIREFRSEDLTPAMRLSSAEGWNQTRRDWQRILTFEPRGCFVAVCANQVIGTVTTTCYSAELAWIGMMLVDPQHRRRGVATHLMDCAIEYLRDQGATCIRLDATPAGMCVYERIGFQHEWTFARWERAADGEQNPQKFVGSPLPERCLELDKRAFGTDRSGFLELLANDSRVITSDDSFGMLRDGRLASYLGPVTAESQHAAAGVVSELLSEVRSRVFWDVPTENREAQELATRLGFTPVRELARMCLGASAVSPRLEMQYAITDPGVG